MPTPTVRLANYKDIEIELNRVLALIYQQLRTPIPVTVFQSVRGNVAEGINERELFIELDIGVKRLCIKHAGQVYYVNLSDSTVTNSTSAAPAPNDAAYAVAVASADLSSERVIAGTANQITVTDGGAGANLTLSAPQNLHTGATPQFTRLGLGAAADATLSINATNGAKIDGALTINDSGNDVDTRIESDGDANAFFLDASDNAVYLCGAASSKIGMYKSTGAVAQSTGWSVTNVTPDKTFDADATSVAELADVLGTLITFLISRGDLAA